MRKIIDIYVNFILSSFGKVEMTKLSKIIDYAYSHDVFTKLLLNYQNKFNIEKELWKHAKELIKEHENEDNGCIIIDDTILEKPYSKENNIISSHWDHSKGRYIRGIGMLNFLYTDDSGISIPVGYDLISKTEIEFDKKKKKNIRKSKITKNEQMRNKLLMLTITNKMKYKYILMDSWFSSAENITFIENMLNKFFVTPLKKNRLVALTIEDKIKGNYIKISSMNIEASSSRLVYLKDCNIPVRITKQVFTNGNDDELSYLYLITNDHNLTSQEVLEIYHKRWKIEEYHKSLKQNLKIEHSPTKVENSQRSHILFSVCGFIKLEKISINSKVNHFAIRDKIYIEATRIAYQKIEELMAA